MTGSGVNKVAQMICNASFLAPCAVISPESCRPPSTSKYSITELFSSLQETPANKPEKFSENRKYDVSQLRGLFSGVRSRFLSMFFQQIYSYFMQRRSKISRAFLKMTSLSKFPGIHCGFSGKEMFKIPFLVFRFAGSQFFHWINWLPWK